MKDYVSPGNSLSLLSPYTLTSGSGMLVGSIFAVAANDAVSGAAVQGFTKGVFNLAKNSAEAWTVGELIYWDDTNKVVTATSSGHKLIGVAMAIAANPSSVGMVRLNGAFIS